MAHSIQKMITYSSGTMMHASFSASAPLHHQLPLLKGAASTDNNNAAPFAGERQQQPLLILSSGSSNNRRPDLPPAFRGIPKKPMRPLTAYHIFFQIEREYVIQTAAGEDADRSIHDNKVYLTDVPLRYRNVKLLPDWFAGPGKRRKRKHRKQHGKIGFLELSRVISTRWARLDETDPETKGFVARIAKRELDEYYREMKAYKEATKDVTLEKVAKKSVSRTREEKAAKKRGSGSNPPPSMRQRQHRRQLSSMASHFPETVSSSCSRAVDSVHPAPAQLGAVDFVKPCSVQLKRDIDDFLSLIGSKTQHLLPSSFGAEDQVQRKRNLFKRQDSSMFTLQSFDSLLGGSNFVERPSESKSTSNAATVNTASVEAATCDSPSAVEVDICDDEILQLWKAHN